MCQHTNSGILRSHVDDHYNGHDESEDVDEAGGSLENERVRDLDGTRVAGGLHTSRAGNLRLRAYEPT